MKILLIEDDIEAATSLQKGLKHSGYEVVHASDGLHGFSLANTQNYDVLIIDRMLPNLDGLTIIRKLREEDIHTPVLILSALGEVDDRVTGLKAGGDDYLVKPYAFNELLARIEVLNRRSLTNVEKAELVINDLKLDLISHTVTRNGIAIRLQPKEMQLLEYFLRNINKIVTRTMLLEKVWGFHFDPETNLVDTQISRLRSKIDKDFSQQLLHTIRGKGYILSEDPSNPKT